MPSRYSALRNIPEVEILGSAKEDWEVLGMLEEDLQRFDELFTAIGRRWSVRDPMFTLLEELSLTPAQLHTIIWLGKDGELSMGTLAERLAISEKTVTGLVDRLERDGLVMRERNENDRRRVLAGLTAEGKSMAEHLRHRFMERVTTMLTLFDEEERAALFGIMEKLAFADFDEES